MTSPRYVYACFRCGLAFLTRPDAVDHNAVIHPGEEPKLVRFTVAEFGWLPPIAPNEGTEGTEEPAE